VLVKDKERLSQGVDDPLRLYMAASQQAIEVFQCHVRAPLT
jgi:hypothetical protein